MAQIRVTHPATFLSDMDRILDSMFDNVHSFGKIGSMTNRHPVVDVLEDEQGYSIIAELPGMQENQVDIKVDNRVLTISSNTTVDNSGEKRYLIQERKPMTFTRSFVLPKEVEIEQIHAEFSQGLLTLHLPKMEKALPKKIQIQSV